MYLKYYSNWIILLFIVWSLGYLFKINSITTYLNLYYASMITCIGFVLFMLYLICYKKYKFEVSFLIVLVLLHFGPFYILTNYGSKQYQRETLFITLLVYGLYLLSINTDPLTIYLVDNHPFSWATLN